MKVSRSQIDSALKVQAEKVRMDQGTKQAKDRVGPAGTDELSISHQAAEIRRLKEVINAMPDERTEKVEALAKQVAEGTYEVKAGDIAEMMLRRIIADRLK
ncbi:MAG: flagellar biosynthesis anti-sigma factor FlgM [Firmicutes bacterium]|nr:flagellar biosynthesis anti-sigma factor FlgM [Bacillota bacterium]